MRQIYLGLAGMLLSAGPASAHAVERGLILLLPTSYYLWGGAIAVAVSFAALSFGPATMAERLFRPRMRLRWRPRMLGILLPWCGTIGLGLLLWTGLAGTRDPLTNPLPLMIWAVLWVWLVAFCAIFGDLWRPMNPLGAPALRVAPWVASPLCTMPVWLRYWPAILGLGLISWFEIVDPAPEDPARLARMIITYIAANFIAALVFGPRHWLRWGEALSVLFRLVATVSPVSRVSLHPPGARLVRSVSLPLGGWLFVIAIIAAVTFDGLAGTFWWLGRNGINPLEFPGRTAMMTTNTAGLLGTWVLLALGYVTIVGAGWQLAGRPVPLGDALGRTALSLLPIALGYHLSHYLTYGLVNGQYALLALNDPFGTGADLFGLGAWRVTTSFLSTLEGVQIIWRLQVGLIVGGHVLAVLVADAVSRIIYPTARTALLAQIPLAAAMVALTLLGLWLLSTPTAL